MIIAPFKCCQASTVKPTLSKFVYHISSSCLFVLIYKLTICAMNYSSFIQTRILGHCGGLILYMELEMEILVFTMSIETLYLDNKYPIRRKIVKSLVYSRLLHLRIVKNVNLKHRFIPDSNVEVFSKWAPLFRLNNLWIQFNVLILFFLLQSKFCIL